MSDQSPTVLISLSQPIVFIENILLSEIQLLEYLIKAYSSM